MTTIGLVRPVAHPVTRPLARFGALAVCAWRAFERAQDVWGMRQRLGDLDDRMLQDLGISRAQAQYEASRPIWDNRVPFEK
jgi:uncharacterized protein YjiS (DUF1127 family)